MGVFDSCSKNSRKLLIRSASIGGSNEYRPQPVFLQENKVYIPVNPSFTIL